MKNFTLLFLSILFSFSTFAQDTDTEEQSAKQQEIGLIFSNLDNFGFTYRVGDQRSLWRFSTVFLNGSSWETEDAGGFIFNDNSFGFGFQVGKEFRRPIVDKLDFRYGLDLVNSYSFDTDKVNNPAVPGTRVDKFNTFSLGLDVILGLNYHLGDDFLIGAEILPGITYSKSKEKSDGDTIQEFSNMSYGFSNNFARLSFMFKF